MNITIIGASAGVGLRTVVRALEAGHTVTTLARTTGTLPAAPALHPITGSALNPGDVTRAITGADAILVTLGTGRSRAPTTLYTDAARTLIGAAQEMGTTAPVITVTGFGAGDSTAYQNPLFRTAQKLLLGKVYENESEMQNLLSTSSLSWDIPRPARLTNGPRTRGYRVITDYTHTMKTSSISRDDVADYLVTEAGQRGNLRRYPALTN